MISEVDFKLRRYEMKAGENKRKIWNHCQNKLAEHNLYALILEKSLSGLTFI